MSDSLLAAGADTTTTEASTTSTTDAGATATTTTTGDPAVTTTATATEATTTADGEADAGKTAPEGAPEAYADFTIAAETPLAPEVVTEVVGLAKELNLTQEKAQKVVDLAAKMSQQGVTQQTQAVQTVHAEWIAATKADKEFGGAKLAESLATAKAAMEATCTPQLQMLLNRSGLGNNAEVIRHFLKIAPAFAQDKHVTGGKPAGGAKTAAQVLYPTTVAAE